MAPRACRLRGAGVGCCLWLGLLAVALLSASPVSAAPRTTLVVTVLGPDGAPAQLPPLTTGVGQLSYQLWTTGSESVAVAAGTATKQGEIVVDSPRTGPGAAPLLVRGATYRLELLGVAQPRVVQEITLASSRLTRAQAQLPLPPLRSRRSLVTPPTEATLEATRDRGAAVTVAAAGGRLEVGGVTLLVLPGALDEPWDVAVGTAEAGPVLGGAWGDEAGEPTRLAPAFAVAWRRRSEAPEGAARVEDAAPPGDLPLRIAPGILIGVPVPSGTSVVWLGSLSEVRVLRTARRGTSLSAPPTTVNEYARGGVVIDGVAWFWWAGRPVGVFVPARPAPPR